MGVFPTGYGWTCAACALARKQGQHGTGYASRAEAQEMFDAHPCVKLEVPDDA